MTLSVAKRLPRAAKTLALLTAAGLLLSGCYSTSRGHQAGPHYGGPVYAKPHYGTHDGHGPHYKHRGQHPHRGHHPRRHHWRGGHW